MLFGSNYPVVDVESFVATFRNLPFTDKEWGLPARRNAERLLARTASVGLWPPAAPNESMRDR